MSAAHEYSSLIMVLAALAELGLEKDEKNLDLPLQQNRMWNQKD
jgi:hypothetical protein